MKKSKKNICSKSKCIKHERWWEIGYDVADQFLPKLKLLRAKHIFHPYGMTKKQWDRILDKMIYSFEKIVTDDFITRKDKKVLEGCELFGKYLLELWD